MRLYFKHYYDQDIDPRLRKLDKKMEETGIGTFWRIVSKIRLGNGSYPLDSILAIAKGKPVRERRYRRVLTDFDLFIIESGMVSMAPGFSEKDVKRRESLRQKAEEAEALENKQYADSLFPDEERTEDLRLAQQLRTEVHNANKEQCKRE